MYTWKYLVTGIDSEDDEKVKSCLEAKFMFGQETAPSDKTKIKDRISFTSKNGLKNYLEKYVEKNKRALVYYPLFSNLAFDLKVKAQGEVPRKEMFDLDALNHFILTGEIK